MKTIITITNDQLKLINYNYEVIHTTELFTTINIEHHNAGDLFYLGCSIGIETLSKAYSTSRIHSFPVVSEDKGHPQGIKTTPHQSTQGDIEACYSC